MLTPIQIIYIYHIHDRELCPLPVPLSNLQTSFWLIINKLIERNKKTVDCNTSSNTVYIWLKYYFFIY